MIANVDLTISVNCIRCQEYMDLTAECHEGFYTKRLFDNDLVGEEVDCTFCHKPFTIESVDFS